MEASPPGYSRHLLESLKQLWSDAYFCDVTLNIGGQKFHAHKNILAASSPFFRAMFLSGMEEEHKSEICLHDVTAETFQALIAFIYSGKVVVTVETCQDLLSAADMFGIDDIIDICSQFLVESLMPSNCIGIFAFADVHNLVALKRQALLYLEKNFVTAVAEDEFIHLELAALLSILASEKLHIESEWQVLNAGIKWIVADLPKRRKHLLQVLNEIRFNLVSQRQISHLTSSLEDQGLKLMLIKLSGGFERGTMPTLNPNNFYHPVAIPKNNITWPRENAKRYIYLVGGFNRKRTSLSGDITTLDNIERYDVYTKKWQSYKGMHHPRSSHSIAVLDRKIVVAGGEDACLITASVESFDPGENVWSPLASMNHPRYGLGLVSLGPFLYAIGGFVGSDVGSSIERYDSESCVWQEVDAMPNPRFCMAVVEYEGLIYISGGLSELGIESDSLESYNPVTKEWCVLASLKRARAYHSLVAHGGCLYAVGGFNEYIGSLSSLEKYSIKDNVWKELRPMQTSRAGAGTAVLGSKMYVFGGRSQGIVEIPGEMCPSLTLNSAECYDFATDVWTDLPNIPCERCEAVSVML